jgi:FtsH-binding integral membrane protein
VGTACSWAHNPTHLVRIILLVTSFDTMTCKYSINICCIYKIIWYNIACRIDLGVSIVVKLEERRMKYEIILPMVWGYCLNSGLALSAICG